MKLDMRMLACIVIMAGAVMNVLPWGGPTARVMSSLKLEAHDVFVPLIPAMIVTALWVILAAWYFGLRERARLGRLAADRTGAPPPAGEPEIRGAVDTGGTQYFWVILGVPVTHRDRKRARQG